MTGRAPSWEVHAERWVSLGWSQDALFELADAVLCADGPVRSLVEHAQPKAA
jgi:hypothetical protein